MSISSVSANVLIYLSPPLLQKQVYPNISITPSTSLLVLGGSECVSDRLDLFEVVFDRTNKIYVKRPTANPPDY